ncbi:tail completion protein gp17 [Methylobacterium fujisawaense]|uniref:tail completion protein gp17 n=1 Tax=Methylobacterium fujisawaense TaxID=107400 RepID=UPI00313C4ED2
MSKRIHDEVPSSRGEAAPPPALKVPYVYFGLMRRGEYQIDCGEAWTIQARLYAVSSAFDRDQGWRVVTR